MFDTFLKKKKKKKEKLYIYLVVCIFMYNLESACQFLY